MGLFVLWNFEIFALCLRFGRIRSQFWSLISLVLTTVSFIIILCYFVFKHRSRSTLIPAPYGGRFEMKVADVPFFVHLKGLVIDDLYYSRLWLIWGLMSHRIIDVEFTQNGKRWSQVMYMYYLIGYRMQNCHQNAPSEFYFNKLTGEVEQGTAQD